LKYWINLGGFGPKWHTLVFFINFGSEIEVGNQQVWGNWVSKVIINKYLCNESCKKKGKKGPKFQVYGMMDRKGDEILSTTSRFCPSSCPRAGLVIPFSIHHT
jgi:hypothetical protein